MKPSTILEPLALALALFTASFTARADLPPPDGQRFVDYEFSVSGLAAHPDWVLLAFPWSMSNGAPTEELAEVKDGTPVGVGRRSGTPKLYAMKRADYETFKKGYTPSSERFQDPALRALFAGSQVIPCDLGPSPDFQLSSDDPRESIVEKFELVSVTAAACDLERTGAAAPTAKEPDAAASDASGESPRAATSPKKAAGCAGCSAASSEGKPAAAFALLGALAMLLRRRLSAGHRS